MKVMRDHLKVGNRKDAQVIADLCELFSEIDFNGDGTVQWEEFTSFLIESAKVQHFTLNRIKEVCRTALDVL